MNDALEGQKRPPPGERQAPLPEVAGPQAAVTVGYVAAGAPSLAVVLVSDMMLDDATVQQSSSRRLVLARGAGGGGGGSGETAGSCACGG